MEVDSCEEQRSSDHTVMILPEGTTYLQCKPHFNVSYNEVTNMIKSETRLNFEHNSKNGLNMNVDKVKNYVPVDIEKGKADIPKPTEECLISSKNDDSTVRTLLRELCSQMGGKVMQLITNNGAELPKFTSRGTSMVDRAHETASNNRSRKYKRTTSFNSRRVVLISSVLSIMGTMILIYLTLRVRQISDGGSSGNV